MSRERKDYWFEIIDTTDGSVYARRYYVEAISVRHARQVLVDHFRNTEYKVSRRIQKGKEKYDTEARRG